VAFATVADHYPLSRKELIDAGLDPNDPQHGRGLCKPCHDRETAQNQPGGWNAHP
jgi:5-methylcytosine-specific restriction protein A